MRPTTGQSWLDLVPTVSTEARSALLTAFDRGEGIDAKHRVALVLDGAGWHTSRSLVVPVGIDLLLLPSMAPNCNRPNGSGHWWTSRWPTEALSIWTNQMLCH